MNASAALIEMGFSLTLSRTGGLVVSPASRLDDSTRGYIKAHLRALTQELAPRHRAWKLTFVDGTGCYALRPAGATREEMIDHCGWQFGEDRIQSLEPTR